MQEMIRRHQEYKADVLRKEERYHVEIVEECINKIKKMAVDLLPEMKSPDCYRAIEAIICKLEDASGAGLEMLEDY